jgi:hypothetical protein
MTWKTIKQRNDIVGGYLEILEESEVLGRQATPPEITAPRYYRGKIIEILWKGDFPTFYLTSVYVFDQRQKRWHPSDCSDAPTTHHPTIDAEGKVTLRLPRRFKRNLIMYSTDCGNGLIFPRGEALPMSPFRPHAQ